MFIEITCGFVMIAIVLAIGLGEYVACQTADKRLKGVNRK